MFLRISAFGRIRQRRQMEMNGARSYEGKEDARGPRDPVSFRLRFVATGREEG